MIIPSKRTTQEHIEAPAPSEWEQANTRNARDDLLRIIDPPMPQPVNRDVWKSVFQQEATSANEFLKALFIYDEQAHGTLEARNDSVILEDCLYDFARNNPDADFIREGWEVFVDATADRTERLTKTIFDVKKASLLIAKYWKQRDRLPPALIRLAHEQEQERAARAAAEKPAPLLEAEQTAAPQQASPTPAPDPLPEVEAKGTGNKTPAPDPQQEAEMTLQEIMDWANEYCDKDPDAKPRPGFFGGKMRSDDWFRRALNAANVPKRSTGGKGNRKDYFNKSAAQKAIKKKIDNTQNNLAK